MTVRDVRPAYRQAGRCGCQREAVNSGCNNVRFVSPWVLDATA
ncbi:hypothetical protein LCGC14_2594310, partial [marine sediment metagenome]